MAMKLTTKQLAFITKLWAANPELAVSADSIYLRYSPYAHNPLIIGALLAYYFLGTTLLYTIAYYYVSILLVVVFFLQVILGMLVVGVTSENTLENRQKFDGCFLKYTSFEQHFFPNFVRSFGFVTSAIVAGLFYSLGDYVLAFI